MSTTAGVLVGIFIFLCVVVAGVMIYDDWRFWR